MKAGYCASFDPCLIRVQSVATHSYTDKREMFGKDDR